MPWPNHALNRTRPKCRAGQLIVREIVPYKAAWKLLFNEDL